MEKQDTRLLNYLRFKHILRVIKEVIGKIIRFFAKTFLILFFICFIVGSIAGGYIGLKFLPVLESYRDQAYAKFDEIGPNTFTMLGDTVIYDKNNNVITEINVGNYEYVTIDNVSPWVSKGYIAVEDKRYRVHNGFDLKALIRASVSLVRNRGEITQGGSTITQQVIKNALLTQERTFTRKFIELFLAPEFEERYTKQQIMEFYVNTNFYGNNCYGIETAAQYYFGKPAKDLTIGEAALFVGMSNNASYYNPKVRYEETMEKREFVLNEMLSESVITQEEYNEAINTPLEFVYKRDAREKEDYLTSYAIHSAILCLMEEEGFEFQYLFEDEADYNEYRERYVALYNSIGEDIRAGGYTLYTSLDIEKQNELQKILDEQLKGFDEKAEDGRYAFQSAMVLVNNETGFVEAMIGGRGTEDEFNRGFLAKRQPGSSIKPLVVYTPSFNTGMYYPSLIMKDEPNPEDKYYPKNYGGGYRGNISIREAVGRSINTIAYQIMYDIGSNTGLEYLSKMRFDTISYMDNFNTAVSLGGFTYGVRVVDMAKGFSTLVNHGSYIDNSCIYKIEYQNQGVIFEEDSAEIQVYEPDAAYLMVDCLKGVMEEYYGTGRSRTVKNTITMAKTGTTNDAKDVWFCGSSAYYSVAVWCGYDTPRATNNVGSGYPGRIWQAAMNYLHQDLEKVDFERPESVVDLYIDGKGNIARYNTGRTDIFSQTLLDKAEEERRALEEKKKIDADNSLIESIIEQLEDLRDYVIKDIDALSYLKTRYSRLQGMIDSVYQEEKKDDLQKDLNSIISYFSVDIENMERIAANQKKISEVREKVEKEKSVVEALNNLDAYFVEGRESVYEIDEEYERISMLIYSLNDESKESYYFDLLDEIKGYKELILKPYREEIRIEEERRKAEKEAELDETITNLEGLLTSTDYVEIILAQAYILYDRIDVLLQEAEEMGISVTLYTIRYETAKSNIEELENLLHPVPPEIENENEGEDIGIESGDDGNEEFVETDESTEIEENLNVEDTFEGSENSRVSNGDSVKIDGE